MIGVVALVGDRDVRGEALDQLVREGDVVALSWRADQAHRISQRIAGGVDFGCLSPRVNDQDPGHPPPFFPASAGSLLMRPHDGGIDHQPFQIGLARQGGEDGVQNAHLDPAVIAALHGFVVAQSLRQIAPTPA